jgi:hypothetical protein
MQHYSAFCPIIKSSSCSCAKAISSPCKGQLLLWYSGNKLELRHHPLIGFYKYDAILFLIIPFDFHSHLILSWQELNSAHQSFARLHSGFFGIPHMFSTVRLLGSRSLPWLIRALLDHISNKVCDAFEKSLFSFIKTKFHEKMDLVTICMISFEAVWTNTILFVSLRLSLMFHELCVSGKYT